MAKKSASECSTLEVISSIDSCGGVDIEELSESGCSMVSDTSGIQETTCSNVNAALSKKRARG